MSLHQETFNICPAVFQDCYGAQPPVRSYVPPTASFKNMSVSGNCLMPVPPYAGEGMEEEGLKSRQQAQNGVLYAQPHVAK